jgi:hypothetical protein
VPDTLGGVDPLLDERNELSGELGILSSSSVLEVSFGGSIQRTLLNGLSEEQARRWPAN